MNEDRRREIGLFRYALVRDAADPVLSKAERGRLVRALCELSMSARTAGWSESRAGRLTAGSATTAGRVEALVPRPRVVALRTPAETLELAFALKRERPERTAAQVREIMLAAGVPALRACGRCRRISRVRG